MTRGPTDLHELLRKERARDVEAVAEACACPFREPAADLDAIIAELGTDEARTGCSSLSPAEWPWDATIWAAGLLRQG